MKQIDNKIHKKIDNQNPVIRNLKIIIQILLLTLLIFVSFIIGKTLYFKEPYFESYPDVEKIFIKDFQKTQFEFINKMSRAIQIRTISFQDKNNRDKKEFKKFIQFLKKSFPKVHTSLEFTVINSYTLLYQWKGKNQALNLKPIVLMGHYDVVPARSEGWDVEPFSGKIVNSYLYGRGTIDDKITVIGILQAAEYLLQKGFRPQRTIFFAFGHDEEIGGLEGAKEVVRYLKNKGIQPEFVIDEGGAVTIQIIPKISIPVATIGISEKGYLTLKLIAEGEGGHSSTPSNRTAIIRLVEALNRLQKNPFPYRLTKAHEIMFHYIGPQFPFLQKMAIANMWLFRPFIIANLKKTNSGRASLHTTMVPTIIKAGIKENIIPTKAEVWINFRLLPGDSIRSVINRVRKIIRDPKIKIEVMPLSFEASPVPESFTIEKVPTGFMSIVRTIKTINPEIAIAPYLVLGATDSRYYTEITHQIYRFVPIYLHKNDMHRMHGKNERISLKSLQFALKFYIILLYHL